MSLSYFFFSPFAIFDIRSCAVPSCLCCPRSSLSGVSEQKAAKSPSCLRNELRTHGARLEKSLLSFAAKEFTIIWMDELHVERLGHAIAPE